MKLTVFLAKSEYGHSVALELLSADILIGDVLRMVMKELSPTIEKALKHSERYGSTIFLSTCSDSPFRLDNERKLVDYELTSDSTLWLMCSHHTLDLNA